MKNIRKLWHREQMKSESREKKEVSSGCSVNAFQFRTPDAMVTGCPFTKTRPKTICEERRTWKKQRRLPLKTTQVFQSRNVWVWCRLFHMVGPRVTLSLSVSEERAACSGLCTPRLFFQKGERAGNAGELWVWSLQGSLFWVITVLNTFCPHWKLAALASGPGGLWISVTWRYPPWGQFPHRKRKRLKSMILMTS